MSDPGFPTRDGLFLRDAIDGEFKDVDEGKRQVLVTFPHDVRDTYSTTFDKDAFRKSFKDRLPLMAWQHDLRDPIGHAIDAQVLPRSNDLVGQFSDFDAVPNAKRAFSQIQDGTITDFSFGFREPVYEPHPRMRGVRNIRSAIMKEFSPVSIGSIPGAKATGLREDDPMSEHSAIEIAELVRTEVISAEEGRRMLAQMDEFREHLTVVAPLGGPETQPDPAAGERDEDEAAIRAEQLRQDLALPSDRPVVADDILGALPQTWQEVLIPVMDIQIAPKGTLRELDFDTDQSTLDEGAETLIGLIDSGCRSADEWLADIDIEQLPEDVRQSIALFRAAGVAAGSLIDVLGLEPRAGFGGDGDNDADDPEDMDPEPIACTQCGGTGEIDSGKTCPRCGGTGIEAVSRAEDRAVPDDAPEGSKSCAMCKGKGKLPAPKAGGHQLKCPKCKGKGWMSPSDQESDTRTDEELQAEADATEREDAELAADLARAEAKLEKVAAKA